MMIYYESLSLIFFHQKCGGCAYLIRSEIMKRVEILGLFGIH